MNKKSTIDFYNKKKVLVTGHTGFKGSWLSTMLVNAGADVVGYSSDLKSSIRLFDLCGVKNQITHITGDVRDINLLLEVFNKFQPEIVIHLAAQPIVRDSYKDPVGTYSINVMGTVNICDVTALQRHLANIMILTSDQLAVADANGDGVVDINDATHLQKYLAEFNVALGK